MNQTIPFKCPVCGGSGNVPNGFYNQTSGQWSTSDVAPETCRSCNGGGIVWGSSEEFRFIEPFKEKL